MCYGIAKGVSMDQIKIVGKTAEEATAIATERYGTLYQVDHVKMLKTKRWFRKPIDEGVELTISLRPGAELAEHAERGNRETKARETSESNAREPREHKEREGKEQGEQTTTASTTKTQAAIAISADGRLHAATAEGTAAESSSRAHEDGRATDASLEAHKSTDAAQAPNNTNAAHTTAHTARVHEDGRATDASLALQGAQEDLAQGSLKDIYATLEVMKAQLEKLSSQRTKLATPTTSTIRMLRRTLMKEGFSLDVCDSIIEEIESKLGVRNLRNKSLVEAWALVIIARSIDVRPLSFGPGVSQIAILGSAGVGTTTAVVQLARSLSWDNNSPYKGVVSMATIQPRGVGGAEAFMRYGSLLNIEAEVLQEPRLFDARTFAARTLESRVSDTMPTTETIANNGSSRPLRILDVPGDLQELRASLVAVASERIVLLRATDKAEDMLAQLSFYRDAQPASIAFSHSDETTSVGNMLSVLMASKLPLRFYSTPRGIREGNPLELFHRLKGFSMSLQEAQLLLAKRRNEDEKDYKEYVDVTEVS